MFNVVAKNGGQLGGHELLQFFLTSGFRFGDMNIFHRHEHSDGTGEVLFSIANMMAPGTFDLEYMEQFNSPGISFFFTAPNKNISVNKSFDMMLRAVEQVAEEFDCEVLNDKREKFTTEQFIEYRTRLEKYA
ncbi:cell division protein ZipA [Psychromonas sp. KJ10-2]|uniref:cell division protein ZipA n=1 Tax=Psychromonas sp. KJ10-2 TaxID=3391822 RepID=UPI0039B475B9